MDPIDDRFEQALDNALRMTFPASDPVAVSRCRSDAGEDAQRIETSPLETAA